METGHVIRLRKQERRKTQRLDLPLKIHYKWLKRKGVLQEIFAQDISGGGMRIRTEKAFRKGQRLKTLLYFPNTSKPIHVTSEVIWCKKRKLRGKTCFDVGVKHVYILPRDRERFVFIFCEAMLNYLIFSLRQLQ